MSPLRLRPEGLRLGWKPIAGFAALLYIVRSAVRHWDFRPDVLDLLVFALLAVILLARPLVARLMRDDDEEEPTARD